MTVGELKELLKHHPDDRVICVKGDDGNWEKATWIEAYRVDYLDTVAGKCTVVKNKKVLTFT